MQLAAGALLQAGGVVRQAIHARVRRNLAHGARDRRRLSGLLVLPVEGGWTAVVRVPAVRSEEALALELLEHEHVLVHPGYFFDFDTRRTSWSACCRPEPRLATRSSARCATRACRHDESRGRRAGLMLPLFSLRSDARLGHRRDRRPRASDAVAGSGRPALLQLLPINELPAHETSPYSALSGMAIDPAFISLAGLPDFEALGGEGALEPPWAEGLAALRASPRINYREVRAVKDHALRRAFARFDDVDMRAGTPRAEAFRAFVEREAWWIDAYALFRALHARARRPAVDRVARGAARPGARGARGRAHPSWTARSATAVPAVDRRRAVAGGA